MQSNIHADTFGFLEAIKTNNDREWFQEHRCQYELAWQNMKDFTAGLIGGLAQWDRYISADIPVSKCVFRIYRDTRFSKDKRSEEHTSELQSLMRISYAVFCLK